MLDTRIQKGNKHNRHYHTNREINMLDTRIQKGNKHNRH